VLGHAPTRVGASLVVAVVLSVTVVLVEPPPPAPGEVETVLFPAGAALHYPAQGLVSFSVPFLGASVVGAGFEDSNVSLAVFQDGAIFTCPENARAPASPAGGPWRFSLNESLSEGSYLFGVACGSVVNVTVTGAIEAVVP